MHNARKEVEDAERLRERVFFAEFKEYTRDMFLKYPRARDSSSNILLNLLLPLLKK